MAQEAIELDPNYGAAYIQLAYTHLDDVWFYRTKSRADSLNMAEQFGNKAIALSGESDRHPSAVQYYIPAQKTLR